MGCPPRIEFGSTLRFSITTHDPETADLTNADSDPKFRLYDDAMNLVGTGEMAQVDPTNTVGYYYGAFDCIESNNISVDKLYHIFISAPVNGVYGAISYTFAVDKGMITIEALLDALSTILAPEIISAIQEAIRNLHISISPETKILGPCPRPVVQMPKVVKPDCK